MKKLHYLLSLLIVFSMVGCGGNNSEDSGQFVTDQPSEMVEEKESISLYEGATLHIAHVHEDEGQQSFFYKESCDFQPYTLNVLSSAQGGQMWDLLLHSENVDKRFLIDNIEDIQGGLSLSLTLEGKSYQGKLLCSSTDHVYSLYIEGITQDTLYVFFDEHLNAFDIMSCSDAKTIMKNVSEKWFPVTENNGEWEIFEECRYGSGHVYVEASFIEFSGGGDAQSYDITEVIKEYGNVFIWYKDYNDQIMELMIEGADASIAKFVRNDETSHYVAIDNKENVKVVQEQPCDED